MKALSLFANIGVAEAYLKSIGIEVVIANEIVPKRAELYQKIYPHTKMICGDLTNYKVFEKVIAGSKKEKIDIIMATPPFQESKKGKHLKDDVKDNLIIPVIDIILKLTPKYAFIENDPKFLLSSLIYEDEIVKIPDLFNRILGDKYNIEMTKIDTKDYAVPQTKELAIILLSRKDQEIVWSIPCKDDKEVTMKDIIGDFPILDPYITDVTRDELLKHFPHYDERKKAALKISKWHFPPRHMLCQVEAMEHTPEGCTAFANPKYKPKKNNGEIVTGYKETYKRQRWDKPGYTIQIDNKKISSQNNVHPGRYVGKSAKGDSKGDSIYSDPRALTIYELMLISSLPADWPIPNRTSEALLRTLISEGIPSLFVKKVFMNLLK
jgi:DNA (cytosine-5)-methyltransferase 1